MALVAIPALQGNPRREVYFLRVRFRVSLGLSALLAVGLLHALMAPPMGGNAGAHRKMETITSLQLASGALDGWTAQQGRVRSDQEALSVLELCVSPVRDAWGYPLIYRAMPGHGGRKFQLRSMGPNGRDDGGDGDDLTFPAR